MVYVGKSPVVASPDPHDVTMIAVNINSNVMWVWGRDSGGSARVAEGQPACQAGLTGQGPGLTCQASGLAYQAGPRPP